MPNPEVRLAVTIVFLFVVQIGLFIPSIYFGVLEGGNSCQHPGLVNIPLSTVLIIGASVELGSVLLAVVLLLTDILALAYLLIVCGFFTFAWSIVLAISLFADSMDCRPDGLWVISLINFIFFALSFCNKTKVSATTSGADNV